MVQDVSMEMTADEGVPVQSLKEIKRSRRTVMLGVGLDVSGGDALVSLPLTPPLSERGEEMFGPEREERYESVDLSSEDGLEWDHSDQDQSSVTESFADEADLLARMEEANSTIINAKSFKPTLGSLKRILVATPESLPTTTCLPSPPPMTIHDFWANVVRNYKLVHRTMPGFLFHKIRDGGIPSVLRRVVWTAMAGITPEYTSEMTSIYEKLEVGGIGGWEKDIGRDLHRTWPEVEMFKEQDGEGQRGLRGVLGGFSVWDNNVGYCQGLGFLAGPLLMQTSSPAEAFTLLTVLMSQPTAPVEFPPSKGPHSPLGYSLRTLYTPNFPGLLSLIYAFNSALTTQFPTLSNHLVSLGVTTEMYAPQWFLSMFAVTGAPIETILLRIWDLLMMEGSDGGHTMIRVGLSLMKLNQDHMLEMCEMEDILKFLLSKDLWTDVEANILIGIAGGEMKSLIPSEHLIDLDREYHTKTSKAAEKKAGGELQAVAGRFLGRLKWTASQLTVDTSLTSPMLRRSSKASFASLQDNFEAPPLMRSQTDILLPSMSRSPSATSFRTTSDNERALHAQIEELVRVLGEVQRKVGESEVEKDTLKTENLKLRELLSRVSSAIPSIQTSESELETLNDEITDVLSSTPLPESSRPISTLSSAQDLRTQLTETQHTLNQERQASSLLQQQLSTTESELSRTRSALLDIRAKYADMNRRERTPSNSPTGELRELKLVVRTKSDSPTLNVSHPSTPSASSSFNSAGSSWSGWFGRGP